MKVAAALTVKDEVELITQSILHLRRIGVERIIACDMGSSDGTYEIMEQFRSDDDFWLFRLNDQLQDHFESWSRAIGALAKSSRADWVIFLDADEFWLPAGGRIDRLPALARHDVINVPRFNVPVGPAGALIPPVMSPDHYDEILLLPPGGDNPREELQEAGGAWIFAGAESKVMARPERMAAIALGGHDIVPADRAKLHSITPQDVLIAHVPFSTKMRFQKKVENIRKVFSVHDKFFGESTAWHWRRWLELADRGALDAEFDQTIFTAQKLAEHRAGGHILSAADIFRKSAALEPIPKG